MLFCCAYQLVAKFVPLLFWDGPGYAETSGFIGAFSHKNSELLVRLKEKKAIG